MAGLTKPAKRNRQILPKHVDLRPNAGKGGRMPKPRKDDTIIHEEPGFRVWKEKGQKGGWVTVQYRESDGRTVTMKQRKSLVDEALEYQKSIEGRRFFGGGVVVRNMPKAFKHVWYDRGSPAALLVKWTNIGEAWRKRLLANGFIKEAVELGRILRVRDANLIKIKVEELDRTLGDAQVEELFNYENTLEHGQYDEYLMQDQ